MSEVTMVNLLVMSRLMGLGNNQELKGNMCMPEGRMRNWKKNIVSTA